MSTSPNKMPLQDRPAAGERESSTWTQGGKFWIYGIFAAFGIFISGVGVFLFIAFSQNFDLVEDNYYEQDLVYDAQQERAQNGLDFGRDLKVEYNRASKNISVDFGANMRGPLQARVQLYRPADAGLDEFHTLELGKAPLRGEIDAQHLAAGKWKVKITWEHEGREHFSEIELEI